MLSFISSLTSTTPPSPCHFSHMSHIISFIWLSIPLLIPHISSPSSYCNCRTKHQTSADPAHPRNPRNLYTSSISLSSPTLRDNDPPPAREYTFISYWSLASLVVHPSIAIVALVVKKGHSLRTHRIPEIQEICTPPAYPHLHQHFAITIRHQLVSTRLSLTDLWPVSLSIPPSQL